ncbi:MAG: cache domain-containing protein [Deltaproteobacteria bacterium]|nr:cache domain-containing protein [Deltaproteobacteria bacterium]
MMKRKSIGMLKLLRGRKISTKLLFWFLCISILPLIILSYFASSSLKNALEVNELKNFYLIAESKNKQIVNYFQEQEKDLDVFSHSPIIIEALQAYESAIKQFGPESEQYRDVEKRFNEYFIIYARKLGYYDLFLINREGDIVFTVKREDDFNINLGSGNYKNTELALALKQAIEKEKITLSKYKYYPPSDKPASFLVAPVYRNNLLKGALAAQLKIDDIFELMRDYSKLGETGEVLIGQHMGDEAVFINPLRFDHDAAFNRKVPFGSDLALPIQDAVQNKEGSGISIDYRGIPIIAEWRYIHCPN